MKVHHLRNATLIIETGEKVILVDPMLGKRGSSAPPFTVFRFKPKRNPILNLPAHAMDLVERTTHCLITHLHPDHLDSTAEAILRSKNTPVMCSIKDAKTLKKRGLNVVQAIEYGKESEFLGGKIQGVPALHGYGFVTRFMGNVMGFYIELPDEPSLYISSDTIYTPVVDEVLSTLKPGISVVAAGAAQLDLFQPLLMTLEEVITFVRNAPGKVIANHLEAVNHCPTTRVDLRARLQQENLLHKVLIPEDGEMMELE